jgi:hypothetical protein
VHLSSVLLLTAKNDSYGRVLQNASPPHNLRSGGDGITDSAGLDPDDHDLSGLDESGGGLASLEVHFAGGTGSNDGSDALSANGDFHFRHEAADAHFLDATHQLIAATDAAQDVLADSFVGAPGAKQQAVHFRPRNAVVAAGSAHAANLLLVDPLLDGGKADAQLQSRFAGGEKGIGFSRRHVCVV